MIQSLGFWHPEPGTYPFRTLRLEWIDFVTKSLGPTDILGSTDFRVAPENSMIDSIIKWHTDMDGTLKEIDVIAWSTDTPTQIRNCDGSHFQGQPFEVIRWSNEGHKHRQPRFIKKGRLFARAFVRLDGTPCPFPNVGWYDIDTEPITII